MRIPVFLISMLFIVSCNGQEQPDSVIAERKYIPRISTHEYKWPDGTLTKIIVETYGSNNDIVMVNVHDNEFTSVDAARKVLADHGGLLVKLENGGERLISFGKGIKQVFDPNRMFSPKGINASLAKHSKKVMNSSAGHVKKFASYFLQFIPPGTSEIIALHNNDERGLSIKSYMKGGEFAADVEMANHETSHLPDDFFYTTDKDIYRRLASRNYNVVLQDNLKVKDDGSLSIYFGKKGTRYVNIETLHGRTAVYEQMLRTLLDK